MAEVGFIILSTNGASAVPELEALMRNNQKPELGLRAIWALRAIGGPAIPALTNALADIGQTNRPQIIEALYGLELDSPSVLALLTKGRPCPLCPGPSATRINGSAARRMVSSSILPVTASPPGPSPTLPASKATPKRRCPTTTGRLLVGGFETLEKVFSVTAALRTQGSDARKSIGHMAKWQNCRPSRFLPRARIGYLAEPTELSNARPTVLDVADMPRPHSPQ
jgi:hypothetical protein